MSPITGIAFVGCGYAADLYIRTLRHHPQLRLVGVVDRDPTRAERFAAFWSVPRYAHLSQVLDDPAVDIVINLTNPEAHAEVSAECLEAGKHVYSEKPLAIELGQARALVELAERRGLRLASAPCSLLGEAAQTTWKVIREGRLGAIRIVYAELDDSMLHRTPYRSWLSPSGTPWPIRNELETGCTLEHAGYQVSWLAAFFGPVRSVTAFASVQVPDKRLDRPLVHGAPDFSVACLRLASGVVARLTCSVLAPRDHRLRIVGDEGVLTVADTWRYHSRIVVQRWQTLRRRLFLSPWRRRIRLVESPNVRVRRRGATQKDFLYGVAELADALREGRASRLSARFALHVNEVVLAIHEATAPGVAREIASTFDPIEPMPWAR